jgi:hypothetical protein
VPADEVVMVAFARASTVERLAVGAPQHVDGTGVDEDLKVPVDGGQADLATLLA